MMKHRLPALVLCAALLTSGISFAAEPVSFTDLPADHWAAGAVQVCVETGLIEGVGDGLFAPEKELNHAECLTLAYRLYDIQHGGDGGVMTAPEDWDGPDQWWRDVCYTIEQKGLEDIFNVRYFSIGSASRYIFADILASAAGELEKINTIERIPDFERDEWREGIYGLYEAGVLTGVNAAGAFQGDKTLTRAEAATMAARVVDPSLRVTFTLAVNPREHTLTPMDLQGWEHTGKYNGVSADWMPIKREVDGAKQYGIYRADGTIFPLERGTPYSGEGPGTVQETRYAFLLLWDSERDDSVWGFFDVTAGKMAVDYCGWEECWAQRHALPPDPPQPDDIPRDLLGFPYGTGDMSISAWDGILSLCYDGLFLDYELAPVAPQFDWVGPLNSTGAGFVSQDGVVYRIQFEKA